MVAVAGVMSDECGIRGRVFECFMHDYSKFAYVSVEDL